MVSIADRNSETGGRSSGFDYLRMALSFLVMCWHSVSTSYEEQADFNLWAGPARPFLGLLMPMFFALSGYLVAWSLFRSKTLLKFILFRMMRIYPALFVETVLSALVLGPLLTTLSLKDYFSDPRFYSYMLNIVGDVHYFLPGLFESNPFPHVVNNQLWTIPYELLSYLALAALSLLGLKRWRVLGALAPVVLTLAYLVIRIYRRGELPEHPSTLNGPLLVITFLAGVAIFSYAERIPWSLWLFAACGAFSIYVLSGSIVTGSILDFGIPFTAAYCTVYLGLTNCPRIKALSGADYSYGIFLYHFAIQQAVMNCLPWSHHWYLNLAISFPLTLALAMLSWRWVEKPTLSLKPLVDLLEKRILSVRGAAN